MGAGWGQRRQDYLELLALGKPFSDIVLNKHVKVRDELNQALLPRKVHHPSEQS